MVSLRVKVKPNARSSRLQQLEDGSWYAELEAPPVDGKANEELIRLVAEQFGVRRAAVSIRRGASGRLKTVEVAV
jgi:uncharacterized protein